MDGWIGWMDPTGKSSPTRAPVVLKITSNTKKTRGPIVCGPTVRPEKYGQLGPWAQLSAPKIRRIGPQTKTKILQFFSYTPTYLPKLTFVMFSPFFSTARCSSSPSCLRYIQPSIPSHPSIRPTCKFVCSKLFYARPASTKLL